MSDEDKSHVCIRRKCFEKCSVSFQAASRTADTNDETRLGKLIMSFNFLEKFLNLFCGYRHCYRKLHMVNISDCKKYNYVKLSIQLKLSVAVINTSVR